jgi:hypothetical protein
MEGNMTFSGAPLAGQEIFVNLPTNFTGDFPLTGDTFTPIGEILYRDVGVNTFTGFIGVSTPTSLRTYAYITGTAFTTISSLNTSSAPFAFNNGDIILFRAKLRLANLSDTPIEDL